MRAVLSVLLVVLAALFETGTGWLHDSAGHLWLDPVLVLTIATAAWFGSGWGVAAGVLGGLLVGAPAGASLAGGCLYGLAGGVAPLCLADGLALGMVRMGGLAALTTLMWTGLANAWTALPLVADNAALAAGVPLLVTLEQYRTRPR